MKRNIGIIDYGMGNLRSVQNACEYIGSGTFISGDIAELSAADGLILPGVGAFPDAMEALRAKGLDMFIKSEAEKKPLLGICLGMQLLFDKGYEVRECDGLGLIPGSVVRLTADTLGEQYKIPHMGWNRLEILQPQSAIMRSLDSPFVYFVHSFKAVPSSADDIIAVCEYGEEICAAVGRGNIFGMQYHPEKSEQSGLVMLKNFINLL